MLLACKPCLASAVAHHLLLYTFGSGAERSLPGLVSWNSFTILLYCSEVQSARNELRSKTDCHSSSVVTVCLSHVATQAPAPPYLHINMKTVLSLEYFQVGRYLLTCSH